MSNLGLNLSCWKGMVKVMHGFYFKSSSWCNKASKWQGSMMLQIMKLGNVNLLQGDSCCIIKCCMVLIEVELFKSTNKLIKITVTKASWKLTLAIIYWISMKLTTLEEFWRLSSIATNDLVGVNKGCKFQKVHIRVLKNKTMCVRNLS